MKFIPYDDKIEVLPTKQETFLSSDDINLYEMGEVIAIGSKVKFVKVGDILYFAGWGCLKTPEVDGVRHYVISENSDFILGKTNVPKVKVPRRVAS